MKCSKCGQWVEVFVLMGGPIGKTGTLAGDETCAWVISSMRVAMKQSTNSEESVLQNNATHFLLVFKQLIQLLCFGFFNAVDDEPDEDITYNENAGEYQNRDKGILQPAVDQIGEDIGDIQRAAME